MIRKDTTNTTAPATIDDATYKAACTAYKSKLNSLIKKYGEPELASTGTSDYQISGVQFAQLVDFNGDGLEELVTVHSKTKAKSFNKKTRLSNGDYVLDVWGYNGKKVVNLYSGSPEASNGGYVFVTFKTMIGDSSNHVYLTQLMSDDTAVLVDDDAEYKYFTYDGTEFKAAEGELHGDNFNYQSAFLIKGYSDNLEDQDASAPEGAIDTSKLNLNNTVDTVEKRSWRSPPRSAAPIPMLMRTAASRPTRPAVSRAPAKSRASRVAPASRTATMTPTMITTPTTTTVTTIPATTTIATTTPRTPYRPPSSPTSTSNAERHSLIAQRSAPFPPGKRGTSCKRNYLM